MIDKPLTALDIRVLHRSAVGDDGLLGIDDEMFRASRGWLQQQEYLNHNFGLTRKGANALKGYTPPDAPPNHIQRIPGLTGFSLTGVMTMLGFLETQVTKEPLTESGRHFTDGHYSNLTSCHHGDTGEFHNSDDSEAIAILWNLWKADLLSIKFVQDEPEELAPMALSTEGLNNRLEKAESLIRRFVEEQGEVWDSALANDMRGFLRGSSFFVTPPEPAAAPKPKPAVPVSRNVEAVLKVARNKIDAAYRDINILVNQLDYLLEATGEKLSVEDRMLVEAIRLQWNTEGKG